MFFTQSNTQVCAGETYAVGNAGCEGASRIEWATIAAPAASDAVFDDPGAANTNVLFPNPGLYTIRRCCYFDLGGEIVQPGQDDIGITACPNAVMEGDTFNIESNCDGTATWSGSGPVSVTGVSETQAIAVATGEGTITIDLSCQRINPDTGNLETITDSCQVTVHPSDQEFMISVSNIQVIEAEFCGSQCVCTEEDVIVEPCASETCVEFKIGVSFKGCPPAIVKPETEILMPQQLVGSSSASIRNCRNPIEKPCEDDICCDPHVPVMLWNDVFNCGWTMTATNSANGTVIASAAGCNVGKKWCFEGPVTITLSGPTEFIDTLMFYNHTMTDADINTTPYETFGGNPTSIGVFSDDACIGGFTRPKVIYWNQVDESISQATIQIDTEGTHCIEHIFAGRKFFLPPMRDTWTNPFNGSGRMLDIREGDCGPVSVTSTRRMVSLEIPIDCVSQDEYKVVYRPLIRYLECGHPFIFSWSINNCPEDIFYGWLDPTDGTPYEDGLYPRLTLKARGYISQQQPKDFG